MEKHTPGPWTVEDAYDGRKMHFIRRKNSVQGETAIARAMMGRSFSEADANARLIAAAPDLLGELNHLVRLLEPLEANGSLQVPGLATLNGARAAIKKARGE